VGLDQPGDQESKRYDGDALIGIASENTLLSALPLSTSPRRFCAQVTLDWLQNDYVSLGTPDGHQGVSVARIHVDAIAQLVIAR
jgi:hypothetical protein